MHENYIVKLSDGTLLCFYYSSDNDIYFKYYKNGFWSNGMKIVSSVRELYTVNLSIEGDIYLFAQRLMGDILLCKLKDGKWSQRVILKSNGKNVQNILFYTMIVEDAMNLIYNLPISEERANYIASQVLDSKGRWQEVNRFDKIYNIQNNIFNVYRISKKHSIIFYQKKVPENSIGYREFTYNQISNYNSIYNTGYQFVDTSFVSTDEGLHFLFITKNMFSSQVIYRKKTSLGFSSPIVLFEGGKVSKCSIFIIKNIIYAIWYTNGQFFYSLSEDFGVSFSGVRKYTKKICADPIKAAYIEYDKMQSMEYICNEVFVDRYDTSDIQILPDLYTEFFRELKKGEHKMEGRTQSKAEDVDESFERLKNQVNITKNEILKKDEQIIRLTGLLHNKNDEIISSENSWKSKYNKMAQAHANIKIMNEENLMEIKRLKDRISELEGEKEV